MHRFGGADYLTYSTFILKSVRSVPNFGKETVPAVCTCRMQARWPAGEPDRSPHADSEYSQVPGRSGRSSTCHAEGFFFLFALYESGAYNAARFVF